MSRRRSPVVRAGRARGPALVTLALLVATGCGALRREPLEVPPGHQLVLGELFIGGFGEPQVVLDIARDDGSFSTELGVISGRSDLVITLPPGRYQITRLRLSENGRTFPEEAFFRVGATFEVGNTAVYVGTVKIERTAFARQVRVGVQDEYERALSTLRARHPELPPVVARVLMRPS